MNNLSILAQGRVVIHDELTGELILDTTNAIHPRNMALIVARSLAREDNGYIQKVAFGNGGTFRNSSGNLVYKTPNILGSAATLYNKTYEILVDELTSGTPATNSVKAFASPAPALTSIVAVTFKLAANEPSGQAVSDNLSNTTTLFTFDEMGLISNDGLLLSHLIFNPVEKTANRAWGSTYRILVSVS